LAQFPVAAAVGAEETGACSGISIDGHQRWLAAYDTPPPPVVVIPVAVDACRSIGACQVVTPVPKPIAVEQDAPLLQ